MDRKIAALLTYLLLMTSCYDSHQAPEVDITSCVSPTATIEQLHAAYACGTRTISEELVVEGTITANDQHGNLFKSFIIESGGYSIEILDGLYDSYVRHPLGGRITLSLKGLALSRYRGVLRTGLPTSATSSYELDYISSEAILQEHVTLTAFGQPLTAQSRQIADLSEDEAGKLVRINALRLHTDQETERTWSGYTLFRTSELDTIWCYTSSYADYAHNITPRQELSLSGILEYGSTDEMTNQFIIVPRSEADCIY